jgi:hypothetical protein
MKFKTKFKNKIFYSVVALAVAGFGAKAMAQADSTGSRGVFRANTTRIEVPPTTPSGSQCGLRVTGSRGEAYELVLCQGFDMLGQEAGWSTTITVPHVGACTGNAETGLQCDPDTVSIERGFIPKTPGISYDAYGVALAVGGAGWQAYRSSCPETYTLRLVSRVWDTTTGTWGTTVTCMKD